MAMGKKTKWPHPNHTVETELQSVETEKQKWVGLEALKAQPMLYFPNKDAQPLEMVPPSGDQLLKCRCL